MSDALLIGLLIGLALGLGLAAAAAVARAGGLGRAVWGLTVAGRTAADPALTAAVDHLVATGPTPPPPPGQPVRLLAALQAEARLVDFLMEDIAAASNDQVGAAVREVHAKARAVLADHLTLVPVLAGADGERVTVPAGFDPSAVRLVGAVSGPPPFTGALLHPGWKVTAVTVPPVPAGHDPLVLQPAEVQVG